VGMQLPVGAAAQDRVPEGLSASDWSSIRAAYEANRHAAFAVEGGYEARNPGQQWRTRFDGRGFETTPDTHRLETGATGWSWGLELLDYGVVNYGVVDYGVVNQSRDREGAVSQPTCTVAAGQRVEYRWDDNLTEWYVNDARGLEHGFTVNHRPDDQSPDRKEGVVSRARVPADSSAARSLTVAARKELAALKLTLAVRGELHPRINGDGRGVTFVNEAGAAVVNYGGLKVFDTTGAEIPAWFEASSGQWPIGRHGYSTTGGRRTAQASSRELKRRLGDPQTICIVVDDSNAIYPLTIDPIAQQAYLKASNTGGIDEFGFSVAVSGDTVVVGAYREDSNATGVNGNQADNSAADSGAAYVFVRSAGVWSQQAYLKASSTEAGDNFGYSVGVSGDTLVVGAYSEDSNATGVNGNGADNSAGDSGAAYVFVRSGGVWSQQAYLKASNTGAGDYFGVSVAVSDDTLVVGAYREDSSATGVNGNGADNSAGLAGAAYVFVRSAGVWSQHAYLKASNTGAGDEFGYSVAISGDTVLVGALFEASSATGVNGNQADNSATQSGAAYVFVRSGGLWSQQAYLKASNTGASDNFGNSVAVSGDTLVVGAVLEDSNAMGVNGTQADNSAANSGAAYVFVRIPGSWIQQAYLKASNTGTPDEFGCSVAVSGDTLVVGAYREASNATGVNGDQTDNSASSSGAAYVFVRSDSVWSQQAYLKAFNTEANDRFGFSVAVSGDTVVVGARFEDNSATGVNGDQVDNSIPESGATYIFTGLGPDADGDGTPDLLDDCPNDAAKTDPGDCGCGVADTDTDGDGTPDCNDGCPSDDAKTAPGECDCGTPDTDTDGDGTLDCNDGCPDDASKTAPGECGCGAADIDSDGNGTVDCLDVPTGSCGACGVGTATMLPVMALAVAVCRRRPS